MKDFLDSVGPGFCLAKWTQATIHLGTGLTHSCHHTKVHHIDAEAVRQNPSALHNTQKKNQDRTAMLHGHRLPDCNYCWRVEDTDSGVSDRVRKSSAPWSTVDQDAIVNDTWREDVNYPRSLEVSFSNVWFNVTEPYGYQTLHDHHGSIFSGTVTVVKPDNSGNIVFTRSDNAKFFIPPEYHNQTDFTHITTYFDIPVGNSLFFWSWEKHYVEQNQSDADRITLSFNTYYK